MKPLNILISNDDGVFAAGIRALAKSAQIRGPVSYTHLTLPTSVPV